jgi:hypothetical protein
MARFSDVFSPANQSVLGTFTAGDLEVDSDTISVDAANNRIGMGVTDPDSKLEVLATTTQQKWSYDANSFATLTVADSSHTTIATGESGNLTVDVAGDIELNADGGDITFKDASTTLASLDASGNFTALGDIILDDGGSLKEAGGTAAITFDGSGNVTKIGQDSPSTNEVLTYDGAKWVASAASSSTDLNALSAAVVDVAADSIGIIDANDSNNSKKESIADLMTAVAGTQATTGLTASSGTLVVTDLHPVGVSGSANQLLTDNGDGTVTSEAKAKVDGATMTIGNGTAEDAMLAFDGNAQDFRIGLDDGTDVLEIGHGTTMGTNTAISVNSSGQVTAFNIPAAAVAQASDHIIFLDGGATGAPKAESIDDFLTAIAGSGISVSSSQLTASGGGTDLNGLSAAVVDITADSIGFVDANDSNNSKKESIADFLGLIVGPGLEQDGTTKKVKVSATNTGTALADGGVRTTADQLGEILAMHVFS